MAAIGLSAQTTGDDQFCKDFSFIFESRTEAFFRLQGIETRKQGNDPVLGALISFPNANSCEILDTPQRATYRCLWKYSQSNFSDALQASASFRQAILECPRNALSTSLDNRQISGNILSTLSDFDGTTVIFLVSPSEEEDSYFLHISIIFEYET